MASKPYTYLCINKFFKEKTGKWCLYEESSCVVDFGSLEWTEELVRE